MGGAGDEAEDEGPADEVEVEDVGVGLLGDGAGAYDHGEDGEAKVEEGELLGEVR